jgi:predicted deacylase
VNQHEEGCVCADCRFRIEIRREKHEAKLRNDKIEQRRAKLEYDAREAERAERWRTTYNAALTGLLSKLGMAVPPDLVHKECARCADLAHGPLENAAEQPAEELGALGFAVSDSDQVEYDDKLGLA